MAKSKPLAVKGVEFPSVVAAARHYGISKAAAQKALARGDCISSVKNSLHGKANAAKPCVIQGVTYPSQAIAAEVLGVSRAHISQSLKRERSGTIGVGKGKRP